MDSEGIKQTIETLRADGNLRLASDSALADLAGKTTRLTFDKGEYVFRTGDAADSYYLVESGMVVLSREAPSGKVFTHRMAVRGTPLNAVTCFRSANRFFSARVMERAEIIAIPCPAFKQWVLANPDVATGILGALGDLLDAAYVRIVGMIDESVETRIVDALNMLSSQIGPDLPLTNADVAELVGTSRESAARTISRLQEDGLIAKSRGAITILDQERLDGLSSDSSFCL